MTPEERQRIRMRAMKACPHWAMGDVMPRPCMECELGAAIAEEREACAKIAEDRLLWVHGDSCYEEIAAAIRARA